MGPPDKTLAELNNWETRTHRAFDMRGTDRFSYVDTSRNNSLSNDFSPSRNSSTSVPRTLNSSESTPNTATPDSMRQFDPDKYFGNMNLSNTGMDVAMGLSDDGGVEFFTEMLGVNLNGS
jgi:hypothetical protein